MTAGTSRVVFATDLHLADGHGGFEAFAADLEEIADLAPDLLVLGGDICLWDSGSGDRLQDLLRDLPVDTMSLLGNHDTDRDFADRFGTPNRCVELGAVNVLGLNTCRVQPQYDDWRNVRGEIGDDDLAWLDTALGGLDRTRPLLLFVHIPLASTYPERRSVSQEITDVWRVTNARAVLDRLADWPAPVVVGQGHLHENEHVHVGDTHLVSVGAVCGRWWQQGSTTRCVDNSPRGWLVVDVDDLDVRLGYRAARAAASWQGEIVAGDGTDGPWLNLFFGDPAQTVEIFGDGEWIALPSPVPVPLDDPFISTHHWALPSIVKGDTLQVRTRMRAQLWEVSVRGSTST